MYKCVLLIYITKKSNVEEMKTKIKHPQMCVIQLSFNILNEWLFLLATRSHPCANFLASFFFVYDEVVAAAED